MSSSTDVMDEFEKRMAQRAIDFPWECQSMCSCDCANAEIAEWRQAAQVEAGLRREFLDRAEKAETEVERLRAILSELVSAIDNDAADNMLLRSAAYIEAQRIACEQGAPITREG